VHDVCVSSEVGGRTQYRLLCKDAGGDTEQTMLHETVPTWVVDVTVQVVVTLSLCRVTNLITFRNIIKGCDMLYNMTLLYDLMRSEMFRMWSQLNLLHGNANRTRAKDVLLNINRMQATEITLPAVTEWSRLLLRDVFCSMQARSIPSLQGEVMGVHSTFFVPGDLDLLP